MIVEIIVRSNLLSRLNKLLILNNAMLLFGAVDSVDGKKTQLKFNIVFQDPFTLKLTHSLELLGVRFLSMILIFHSFASS